VLPRALYDLLPLGFVRLRMMAEDAYVSVVDEPPAVRQFAWEEQLAMVSAEGGVVCLGGSLGADEMDLYAR
jgi:hypothetical protein